MCAGPHGHPSQPADHPHGGPRVRHRHGGQVSSDWPGPAPVTRYSALIGPQLHDARARQPGRPPPQLRLRRRLRHRRRRLLRGFRRGPRAQRHARQELRVREDADRGGLHLLPLLPAADPAEGPAEQVRPGEGRAGAHRQRGEDQGALHQLRRRGGHRRLCLLRGGEHGQMRRPDQGPLLSARPRCASFIDL